MYPKNYGKHTIKLTTLFMLEKEGCPLLSITLNLVKF